MAGIFNNFDTTDVVSGRTTRVASGFWPDGLTYWSQSYFVDDFWSLTSVASPSPSYGVSIYDIRRTMYYLNVYPNQTYLDNNDPYFSITYGNINGDDGSGSFNLDTGSIKTFPTKAIYTQYKNILLGTSDLDGKFTFKTGSSTIDADDIFVMSFSTYKMKDKVDEGIFEVSLSGSNGTFTFVDDSVVQTQGAVQSVYQLISGSIANPPVLNPTYAGIGALYPNDGIVIFNAAKVSELVGWASGSVVFGGFSYTSGSLPSSQNYTSNHKFFFESLKSCGGQLIKVRKSEFVPARHYFVRVKNRDFNYSNNPTYVYDGTDGIHAKGTIRNTDFVNDPKTYITTVGLYNENNELVAVAKLSRPAVKSFDNELLIKVRLDF